MPRMNHQDVMEIIDLASVRASQKLHGPQPGDIIRATDKSKVCGHKDDPGEVIGILNNIYDWSCVDKVGMAVYGYYTPFRGKPSGPGEGNHVSVSGGPCSLIPINKLVATGEQREITFWCWKDRPRANGGREYKRLVNVWDWEGQPVNLDDK